MHSQVRETSIAGMELTDRDRAILDFERSWWAEAGPKEALIREKFELSATRYYQILNELLEAPEAYAYDPLVVRKRLANSAPLRTRSCTGSGMQTFARPLQIASPSGDDRQTSN